MVRDEETGLCSCTDGLFMDETHGCLSCDYMIPGCRTCSEVAWDSAIPLDFARMKGPDQSASFLTCDTCSTSERYVHIDAAIADYTAIPDDTVSTSRVTCKHCQASFDGCTSCGTYGAACEACAPTHVLLAVDADGVIPCTRCDYFMSNCLTCFS